jgi:hypothetical protein
MKEITKFIAWVLFSILSSKRRPKSIYQGHRWENGGKEPGVARQDGPVKFEV